MRRRGLALPLVLALLAPAALAAQRTTRPAARDTARIPMGYFIVPAAFAGTAGAYMGALGGGRTGWGGGDDPGLTGALVFGVAGAAAGSALAAYLVGHGRLTAGEAIGSGVMGVVGGIAGALLAARAVPADNGHVALFGFAIGDGLLTALFASANQ